MNRRTVLSLAAVAAGTLALPRLSAAQDDEFESGGLGLPISAWEESFGPGEAGQSYQSYALADGNYWVGVSNEAGVVDYIERNWAGPATATLAEVEAEVGALLPADARLVERFVANYAAILNGLQIDRYQSRSLGDLFEERGRAARSFVVSMELVPAEAAFDQVVSRVVIVVGTDPAA